MIRERDKEGRQYKAALYMRLSKDDGTGESASINTQRSMLRSYADRNGFFIYGEYADDGYSGTTYDRPAWKRLLADIEAEKVNLVITRDLSRLGRDYILTGQYTEIYFPAKGVRYIAVNDGYDSNNRGNDLAPFQNIVNEMYARDTSKKIRSALRTKMEDGAYIGNYAPYGYRKDPGDRNHLLIDPLTAPVVRDIFERASRGEPPLKIAKELNERCIKTPASYRRFKRKEVDMETVGGEKGWTSSTICKILSNRVYTGDMVQGKTSKLSFKSQMTLRIPKEEWIVVENKHNAIVSKDLFEQAGRRSVPRKRSKSAQFSNAFSGLVYCGDCKRVMTTTGGSHKEDRKLVCSGYKQYGRTACTNHYMKYDLLCQIVSQELETLITLSEEERKEVAGQLEFYGRNRGNPEEKRAAASLKKRERQIERIIGKLYEDRVNEVVGEERFCKLLISYEQELKEIGAEANALKRMTKCEWKSIEESEKSVDCLLIEIREKRIPAFDLLHQFIDRIEIFQSGKDPDQKDNTIMTVRICYRSESPDSKKA
ncbi:recombinase family protein [Lacrimispora sp. AGF001]|uniref:recombinase family protein n=1 Tax=Lacrimispora sp. AGF001 TaxID=3401631 RepID=UPI003B42C945